MCLTVDDGGFRRVCIIKSESESGRFEVQNLNPRFSFSDTTGTGFVDVQ